MGSETELLLRLEHAGAKAWYVKDAIVEHVVPASQSEPDALVRRAYRYGRGRWRLRTSRLSKARLRVRGLPLSVVSDLLSRRLSYARATRRGDEEATLRAAWRIAYLAGHVAEVRRERGRAPGIGVLGALVPPSIRRILAAALRRPADGTPASESLMPAPSAAGARA